MATNTNSTSERSAKKSRWAPALLIAGLSILLLATAFSGYRFYQLAFEQKRIKEDYSLSNNITFGIFSVDRWGEKISAVVDRRVKGFKLTGKQKADMQEQVEKELHGMVNKAVADFTKPKKGLGSKLKKLAFDAFVDVDELHAQVPSFARTIVVKITSPASLKRIKGIATSKVDELEAQTYDRTDTTITTVEQTIYQKYKVKNSTDFDQVVKAKLDQITDSSHQYAFVMIISVAIALLLWVILRKRAHLHVPLFIMSLLFAVVLLAVGVISPIIEVDARIQSLEFALMGDKLAFTNQVLFFQSKSIIGII
ncbi:MAG: 2-methylisocitrate lyase, partial [Flavobacterium sp.]